MTRFEAKLDFGADSEASEVEDWAKAFLRALPEGATAHVRAVPMVLDLTDVTEEHAGNVVTVRGYFDHIRPGDKEAAAAQARAVYQGAHLTGVLEHVYPTGGTEYSRTFIINGKAYNIPAYSVVELGEW